jgi:uncharacterized protein YjdB
MKMQRKINGLNWLRLVGSLLLIHLFIFSCKQSGWIDEIAEERKLINTIAIVEDAEIPLLLGRDTVLHASFSPDSVTNETLIWSSSDESVATVDQQGNVQSKGLGTANIQVRSDDGGLRRATVKIIVIDRVIYAEQILLDIEELDTYPNVRTEIKATVVPDDVTYKKLEWSSSDENIATVNHNGVITGIAAGTATITVKPVDGSGATATVSVNVVDIVPIESIIMNTNFEEGLGIDERVILDFDVLPAQASKQLVEWLSGDESIVQIDQNGVLTAVGFGETTIIAKSTDGGEVAETFTVKVLEGKINDSFIDGITPRWIAATGGSSINVNNNIMWVTLNTGGANRRGDFRRTNTTLHIGEYPIIAFKFKRPLETAGNIFLDTNHGRWKQSTGNGNNQMEIIKDNDGVEVFYADLGATNTFGTGGFTLPTNTAYTFSQISVGVADMPDAQNPLSPYPVYWVKTFKSVAELEAFINQ